MKALKARRQAAAPPDERDTSAINDVVCVCGDCESTTAPVPATAAAEAPPPSHHTDMEASPDTLLQQRSPDAPTEACSAPTAVVPETSPQEHTHVPHANSRSNWDKVEAFGNDSEVYSDSDAPTIPSPPPVATATVPHCEASREIEQKAGKLQEGLVGPTSTRSESMPGDFFHTTMMPASDADAAPNALPLYPPPAASAMNNSVSTEREHSRRSMQAVQSLGAADALEDAASRDICQETLQHCFGAPPHGSTALPLYMPADPGEAVLASDIGSHVGTPPEGAPVSVGALPCHFDRTVCRTERIGLIIHADARGHKLHAEVETKHNFQKRSCSKHPILVPMHAMSVLCRDGARRTGTWEPLYNTAASFCGFWGDSHH